MPYASVIIPVHKRYATLSYALASIQQQTISDIEIILAGDGCTEKVRSICEQFANVDSRIRFLDFPKAPLRGVLNRDKAVRLAHADKIFYCDDDDFFLPHHIETLGEALSDCDVVDTPPVTVCPEGHVELGIHDSGHRVQKDLLLNERFKGVFDTHLAHTKQIYVSNAGAWLKANDPRVVLHMLKSFAGHKTLIWKTINRITALSLHGARRAGMSPLQRETEMKKWAEKINTPDVEKTLREEGRYGQHLMKLLWALNHTEEHERSQFLSHLGFTRSGFDGTFQVDKSSTNNHFSRGQLERISTLLELYQNKKSDLKKTGRLVRELLTPLLGPGFPSAHVVNLLSRLYNESELTQILQETRDMKEEYLAQIQFTLLHHRSYLSLLDKIRSGEVDIPTFDRFFFFLCIAQCLFAKNLNQECFRWCNYMLEFPTQTRYDLPYWELRKSLVERLDLKDEIKWVNQQLAWFVDKI